MSAFGTLIGNLGRDPERVSSGAYPFTKTSIATTAGYGDRKKTTWWNVTAFGKQGEALARCRKGSYVAVSGELFEDTWTDSNGNQRKSLNITANNITFLTRNTESQDAPMSEYQEVGAPPVELKTGYSSIPTDADVPF